MAHPSMVPLADDGPARPKIKICGLTQPSAVDQVVALGADFAGFIFYPPSPRSLHPHDAAALVDRLPVRVKSVGVMVDPTDDQLDALLAIVPLDTLQLHGNETPARVAEVGLRTGCRVMKAIRVETAADVATAATFEYLAELLLFDAKPQQGAAIPGGNGLAFDWRILQGCRFAVPWALAGGLDAANIEAALHLVAPPMIDVSSGVESSPGIKDPAKLEAFFQAVADAAAAPFSEPHSA